MPDLERLMKRAADAPTIEADIERAWSRGKTLRARRRLAAASAAVCVLVIGGIAVGAGVFSDGEVPPVGESAITELGASYDLSRFTIDYPYEPPGDGGSGSTWARVGYTATWANEMYPGEAPCRMTLFDDQGELVGELDFTLDSGSEVFRRPPGKVIEVTGEPTSVEASCTDGNVRSREYPDIEASEIAPAYDTSDPTGPVAYEDRLSMTFDIDWPGEADSFQKTCRIVVVHRDDSESVGGPFNTNMGEGPQTYNVFVGDPTQVETAYLRCLDLEN